MLTKAVVEKKGLGITLSFYGFLILTTITLTADWLGFISSNTTITLISAWFLCWAVCAILVDFGLHHGWIKLSPEKWTSYEEWLVVILTGLMMPIFLVGFAIATLVYGITKKPDYLF